MQPPRRPTLYAATFVQFFSQGILLGVLPQFVSRELGADQSTVGLSVGAFAVAALVARPFIGRLIDSRGRRFFLVAAPCLLAGSILGLVAADTVLAVIALRLVHGVAGSTYYTAAATCATDLAQEGRRASAIARFSLFLYAGFATGPALGDFVLRVWSFSAAWVLAAVAALGAAALSALLPETMPARREKVEAPRGVRMVVHPAAVGPGMVLLCGSVGYTAISVFLPLYAPRAGLESAGALYATFSVVVIAVRLTSGRLADRVGPAAVAAPGMASAACGLLLLGAVHRPWTSFVGVAIFGGGFALVFPALMAVVADRAGEGERAAALGSFTAFFDVGAAAGGWLVGALADAGGDALAFGVPAALCLSGAAVVAGVGRTVAREAEEAAAERPLPEPAGA